MSQTSLGDPVPTALTKLDLRLVEAAERVARSLPVGNTHTVAAAAMSTTGDVFTGVNVHHFTGGPCAELVAIAAAAQADAGPLITIVAVGDGERGVLAPCGRCRQVLSDLHPDVHVIVPAGTGELTPAPVRDLLPGSYADSRTATGPRVVHFHPRHYDAIESGRKTLTIRHRDPVLPGPAIFVFEDDNRGLRRLHAEIDHVETRRVADLTDADAQREALPDLEALLADLSTHYPDLGAEDVVEVAGFHLKSTSRR